MLRGSEGHPRRCQNARARATGLSQALILRTSPQPRCVQPQSWPHQTQSQADQELTKGLGWSQGTGSHHRERGNAIQKHIQTRTAGNTLAVLLSLSLCASPLASSFLVL